ncbi:type I-E CRISPR-associated protein Cse2/CasB [Myceligenerans pegani]|uniref:Type I-E CRISPR-associated protein Cse2/CasB n=1 Tax=Myceligenerans pegani TaxID=2776917 RepID=A0ABR9N1C4_9MICO|nr:type I-E CRISPR-associated protein Cse2/CasB [Myceligenerans sp. TRM 65318]MBE1877454.1 type I-E CRISPR-associated protein Cse2/CasB [Myceligenerans sp. TRM 65318]MBE3019725.1 type I-E CRISPR-associated protein Cse2/CasB [Myceligenerans sp. TRM 65318]
MTDTIDETAATPPEPGTAEREYLDKQVGDFVRRRVTELQKNRNEPGARGSRAVALLARLRRAADTEPGADASIWDATFKGAPEAPTSGSILEPTKAEWAIHIALTTYAVHQQSGTDNMHEAGARFATAVRRLEQGRATGDGDRSPVRRRFDALVTSSTLQELAVHLRGIVKQMRSESIAFDYGLLAQELYRFQVPRSIDRVRRDWARDYYASLSRSTDKADGSTDTTKEN